MDRYTLTARLFPMTLFYLPIIFLGIVFSFHFDKYVHLLTSLGVVSALSYFTAQIGRKGGKAKESDLWKSWGGAPTTQLLRWRDNTIDSNTKKRYHFKLQVLCPVENFPTREVEDNSPSVADDAYQAWVRYLISKTRDTKKYDLLFKENINYGFWRNLWALKPYAIGLLIFLMIGTYLYFGGISKSYNPEKFSHLFFIGEAVLLASILVWIFAVRSKAIKIPAFAYAERLLETADGIKN